MSNMKPFIVILKIQDDYMDCILVKMVTGKLTFTEV